MFTKVERLISSRNLRPKKKEGFLKIISIFSFLGIMLGVAILIIVMSVMNGFKTDLTKKILGLNPHIIIQPNSFTIDDSYISKLNSQANKHIKTNNNVKLRVGLIGIPFILKKIYSRLVNNKFPVSVFVVPYFKELKRRFFLKSGFVFKAFNRFVK